MLSGVLQVLLPLLLALATLHGHLEQPPAPDAQPEEPGFKLEQRNPVTQKGLRKNASVWGEAALPRRVQVSHPSDRGSGALHQALGISQ